MRSSSICARIVTFPAAALLALGLFTSACTPSGDEASDPTSLLVGRILLAEDGRDASDSALVQGEADADPAIRALAVRARARITDPTFARRDSVAEMPTLPAPPTYDEPAWRLRLRALGDQRSNCGAMRVALTDSAWPVRLRAIDIVDTTCARDAALLDTLTAWVDALPADASSRPADGVSWHHAAHALVALTRLQPDRAAARLASAIEHEQAEMREYATRAASQLGDSTALIGALDDASANVRALALDGLRRNGGHLHDDRYFHALDDGAPQVVRSAALALAGSPHPELQERTLTAFEFWVGRQNATERDVRHALLKAAGRDTSDDRPPAPRVELPRHAVALALGEDIRVQVTMAASSGGGEFTIRMRGDVAPMMAAHILELVEGGYYDGLTWHRVEHDFVVQGGSPDANEFVGLPYFLRDQLGTVPHARGTVGMSTRGHDTGDGQWFFNLRDNLRLNGDYTVFAEITDGINVVDGILEGDVIGAMRVIRER